MSTMIAAFSFIFAMSHANSGDWVSCGDDDYAVPIAQAVQSASHDDRPLTQAVLRGSMRNWKRHPDYASVRRLIQQMGPATREMVRLEIGNENDESYEVVWVVRGEQTISLITNRPAGVSLSTIPAELWVSLVGRLERANIWHARSLAHTALDDGSSFFVSACLNGKVGQFAIYGLPGSQPALGEIEFAKAVSDQAAIIGAILDLLPTAKRPQRR